MARPEFGSQLSISAVTEASTRLELVASQEQAPRWSEWLGRSGIRVMFCLMMDLAAVLLAQRIAESVVGSWLKVGVQDLAPTSYYLFFLPLFAATLYIFNAYRGQGLQRPERELELLCKAVTFSFLLLITGNFVVFRDGLSRYFVVAWYLSSLVLLLVERFCLRVCYGALWKRGLAQQRAVLIGLPHEWMEFQEILSVQRHQGYKVMGALTPGECEAYDSLEVPILGQVEDWERVIDSCRIDLVVVCSEVLVQDLLPKMWSHCTNRNIALEACSTLFETQNLRFELDEFSGFLRFRANAWYSRRIQLVLKEILDRLIGLVGSLFTLLLILPIGALIKCEDFGPVFYRSAYLDQNGRVRYYLKFRTMCVNADHVLATSDKLRQQFESKYKLETDPRVTRIGRILRKYSLDEFPQFFSVLLGKLSFVGPRTIRQEEAARYGELLPKLLTFKPGVTGYWQVMGRQTTTYEERIQMNMFYIDHWSIWLDLVIVAKTFWQIISPEGAY